MAKGRAFGGDPIPAPADYNGGAKTDIAVFQPSTSTFYVKPSSDPSHAYAVQFGQGTLYGGDPTPVPADYNGGGKAQLAVYQPMTSTFYIQNLRIDQFGQGTLYGGDPLPVPADYKGLGYVQDAVFQQGSSTFFIKGVGITQFGQGTLYGGNPIPLPIPFSFQGTGNGVSFRSASSQTASAPSRSTAYFSSPGFDLSIPRLGSQPIPAVALITSLPDPAMTVESALSPDLARRRSNHISYS